MAYDFPSSPTNGQEYTSGSNTFVWNGDGWTVKSMAGGAAADYVKKSGDTMTGDLTLPGNPSGALMAVPKQYADSIGTTLDNAKVAKAGDTMTGNLTIDKAGPTILLNKTAADQYVQITSQTAGKYRWTMHMGDSVAEGGSNAGSNFNLFRADDAGNFIGTPALTFSRATGKATFGAPITVPGALTSAGADVENAAIRVSGSFGGGVTLVDGGYRSAIWAQSGDLALGTSQTATTAPLKLLIKNNNAHEITGSLKAINPGGVFFRERTPTHSVFHYTDSATHYFLVTNNNDPDGSWNSLRPFSFNLNSGAVTMSNGVTVNGASVIGDGTNAVSHYGPNYFKYSAAASGSGAWYEVPGVGYRFYCGTDGATDTFRIYSNGWGNAINISNVSDVTVNKSLTSSGVLTVNERIRNYNSTDDWSNITINNSGGGNAHGLYVRCANNNAIAIGVLRYDGAVWHHRFDANGNASHAAALTAGSTINNTSGAIESAAHTRAGNNYWYTGWGGHYFFFDGGNWQSPWGSLLQGGYWVAREGTTVSFGNITGNDIISNANVDCGGGNYYFVHNGGIYMRWRGDLSDIEFSHGVYSYNGYRSRSSGNHWNFAWDGTLKAIIDGGDWGSVLNVHSDYRLKKDVTNLGSMWETVKGLRPVSFTSADWAPYSVLNDIVQWGFLAHELQETLLPTAATGTKDCEGAPQQPFWTTVVAAMCKALQEAMARIEALEATKGT